MSAKNMAFFFFCFLFLIGATYHAEAQPQAKKLPKVTGITFLNGGQTGDGDTVSVQKFDSLLSLPLVVRDTSGKTFPVASYGFVYICRGIYADSTGRPIIKSDYYYSQSTQGLLPGFWLKGLIPKVKAGDTAIFTDIRYYNNDTTPDNAPLYSKSIRVILK